MKYSRDKDIVKCPLSLPQSLKFGRVITLRTVPLTRPFPIGSHSDFRLLYGI